MKMNNTVLIRKLGAVDAPLVRTPADDVYVVGAVNLYQLLTKSRRS